MLRCCSTRTKDEVPGRQILVSEYHASILSSLVAIALTLTGPQFWILIKAFMLWMIKNGKKHFKTARRQNDRQLSLVIARVPYTGRSEDIELQAEMQSQEITSTHEHNENMVTTQNSHSELGAALKLIGNVWRRLKLRHIELSTESATAVRQQPELTRLLKFWENFLQQPADIALSLLLSAIFIGLFVAHSSGSILSARIVSDGIALSSSPGCFESKGNGSWFKGRKLFQSYNDYSEKCYHAHLGADGCTTFYNQSISYTEQVDVNCPFSGNGCMKGIHAPIAFDTGLVDSKYLGINAAKRHRFRRRTTCTPFVSDVNLMLPQFPEGSWASDPYSSGFDTV